MEQFNGKARICLGKRVGESEFIFINKLINDYVGGGAND